MQPSGIHMICVPCDSFHMQSVTAGNNKKQLAGEISHKHKKLMSCTPFKYKYYIYGSCFSECCWREPLTHPGLSSEGLGKVEQWKVRMCSRVESNNEASVRGQRPAETVHITSLFFDSHTLSSKVLLYLQLTCKHKFIWQERSRQMFNTMKNIYLTFYHHCCWHLNYFKLFSVQGTFLIFRWMPLCLCYIVC